jgi:hypothetical protein
MTLANRYELETSQQSELPCANSAKVAHPDSLYLTPSVKPKHLGQAPHVTKDEYLRLFQLASVTNAHQPVEHRSRFFC